MNKGVLAWACAAALLAAGCASTPPPRALVIVPSLPDVSEATPPTPTSTASPVALAPIKVPEHWQRRAVLHLRGEAELVAWPDAVWAERVETGLTRRLSQALRQRAPEQGWWVSDDAQTPRRLLVDVQQLDVHAQRGELVAVLNWRLVDRQGRGLDGGVLNERLQAPVGNAQQEAQALALWLDRQAQVIAERVQRLSDKADTTTSQR